MADLRREPDGRAERVSQLLLFSLCEELEGMPDWWKVRGPDGYVGWVKESHTAPGDRPDPRWKVCVPVAVVRDTRSDRVLGRMTLDTRCSGTVQAARVDIPWPTGEVGWIARKAVRLSTWVGTIEDVLAIAQQLVGVPYLWGGTSPFGFDCSGLVQRLFHLVFNRWLPRDSEDQREFGPHIPDLYRLQPGDLVFFPGHVGIWLGNGRLVHASGRLGHVTVTRLIPPEGAYAQQLVGAFLSGVRIQPEAVGRSEAAIAPVSGPQ
ncbi:MAG: C40 family peptidase [Candidatus Bipolaricaulota bacterium]